MTQENRPVAALVDAYTTGNFLPPAFARLGVDVVHVQSTPELLGSMLAPDLSAYRANLVPDAANTLAGRLAEHAPVAVAAGQEPGVPLADELSEALGLATNGSAQSTARRDKYEMIEALRSAGVRCADQFKSDNAEAIVDWAVRRGEFPVVVKPLSSAATDGVAVCGSVDEVRKAAETVLSTRTIYEETNREVLVQSYLAGEEYVVDMVSCQGQRYTCGVWQYHKRLLGTHNIYDRETNLPDGAPLVRELVDYVDSALAALGIDHGPTHAEVIVTPEGPALVEVGARLAGNMHPGFHDLVLGANQADLTALAYARPDEFLEKYAGRVYRKQRPAAVYTAPTELDGTVDSVDQSVVEQIESLETVYAVNVKIKPGGRIRPTVDLYTSTLRIFMAGADENELLHDYRSIQELKDRVYRLA
ncbi:ATP-grasp domain-containing protein [Streptomyces sp. NPDC051956]|uniref:ATP-grasp domain-containing protein n=1 Tax=Streptomyces sp. NPDC051956 TaxID=3365677 RepID=UPI0037CF436E